MDYYRKALFLYGSGQAERVGISPLVNPVYDGYYKDALLLLNFEQRSSFHRIHSNVKIQNSFISKTNELINEMEKESHNENAPNDPPATLTKLGEHYGLTLKGAYSNCHVIRWHIDHHFQNIDNPELPLDKEGIKKYKSHLTQVAKEMEEIVLAGEQEAKG